MSTPLSIYRAAERLITASARMNPACLASMAAAQTDNVLVTISKLTMDPSREMEANTELLEELANDRGIFSEEQRTLIGKKYDGSIDREPQKG